MKETIKLHQAPKSTVHILSIRICSVWIRQRKRKFFFFNAEEFIELTVVYHCCYNFVPSFIRFSSISSGMFECVCALHLYVPCSLFSLLYFSHCPCVCVCFLSFHFLFVHCSFRLTVIFIFRILAPHATIMNSSYGFKAYRYACCVRATHTRSHHWNIEIDREVCKPIKYLVSGTNIIMKCIHTYIHSHTM